MATRVVSSELQPSGLRGLTRVHTNEFNDSFLGRYVVAPIALPIITPPIVGC